MLIKHGHRLNTSPQLKMFKAWLFAEAPAILPLAVTDSTIEVPSSRSARDLVTVGIRRGLNMRQGVSAFCSKLAICG